MNPLMGGRMGNLYKIVNQIQNFRQNPNGIADFLKQQGRISDEQYNAIHNMNSPEEIGQYLMKSGSITQQNVMDAQRVAPQFLK
jgi:hypothetical protein